MLCIPFIAPWFPLFSQSLFPFSIPCPPLTCPPPPLWFPAHASIYPLFIFTRSYCRDLSSSASTPILVIQPFSPHFYPVSRATSSTRLCVCVSTHMRVCVPSMQKQPQKKDLELQKSGIMQMNPASDNGLQQDLSQLIEVVWNEPWQSL